MISNNVFASVSNGTIDGTYHYAWGENIGWVDFSKVIIDNNGIFTGSAYGENIGFITFNTNDNNKVLTDWRPRSTRSHGSSGGSTPMPIIINNIQTLPINQIPQTTLNITRNLKLTTPRMKGDDVKILQNYLNTHSYNSGIADGIFGNKTKASVIKFQLANQLKGDGIVGLLTRSKLK
jgi:peptidoglycan hydrolase-like protein with peptidoglycan-binding domain